MSPRRFEQAYEGVPETVGQVRRFVRQSLAGLPRMPLDEAVLCASELSANAIRHSRSGFPGGEYQVRIEVAESHLQVEVVDQGGDTAPEVTLGGDESGRGLWAVTCMGSLGHAPAPAGAGRRVWALLPRGAQGGGSG